MEVGRCVHLIRNATNRSSGLLQLPSFSDVLMCRSDGFPHQPTPKLLSLCRHGCFSVLIIE